MRRLSAAGFSRLWRDKSFWLGALFMFGLGIFVVLARFSDIVRYNERELLDDTLFVYAELIGGCAAVFYSMFIGTEYSDGTIRNKLVVGCTRGKLYCSNLLLSVAAAVMMAFAFLLSYCGLGVCLLEPPQAPLKTLLFYMAMSLFTIIAYASLYNMLAMLITKKSVSAVSCLLVFFGLLILAMVIYSRLDAPEFISGYIMGESGLELDTPKPNPKYLQPAARKVYQFFYDLLPSGQSIQLATCEVARPASVMLLSLATSGVSTVVGILVFRKKDLR